MLAVRSVDMYQLIKDLRDMEGVADCYAFGEYAHLKFRESTTLSLTLTNEILAFLNAKNHQNIEIKPVQATIEDCFIEFIKH